jgi:alpha-ketoglutaric semialdehyde dehydrogenase
LGNSQLTPASPAGKSFHGRNPVTGEALEPAFASASAAQVEQAASAAAAAFPDYSRRSGRERAALLRGIAAGIEALGHTLIEQVILETALPAVRVTTECARTCMQLRMFADVAEEGSWVDERIDAADPTRQPPKPQVRSLLRPLGPVVVFGASNFPLAFSVAGGDTASALAVGCPVIVKAHPAHPNTSAMVGKVIDAAVARCGLPKGVFSLLFDAGYEVGLALVQHPAIKAGTFTGSIRGGLALLRAAQGRSEPMPFFAEMGSVNPVFILPGALVKHSKAIAAGLQAPMGLGCGQFCTKPGLIFLIDDPAGRDFLETLAELFSMTPAGALLTQAMRDVYEASTRERAASRGVQTLAKVAAVGRGAHVGAALFAVDAAAFIETPSLAEEIFGPTSLVILCRTFADYERCAERLQGQLTATVWADAQELRAHGNLLWLLEQKVGRLLFNGFPTGVEVGPAMMHGGPFPSTSDSRFTSVGTRALLRFVRPVAYQNELY